MTFNCIRCGTEMVLGKALGPTEPYGNVCRGMGGPTIITAENMEMVDVYKCPKCGHSESIEDDN